MPLPFDSVGGGKTIGVAGAKITTDVSSFAQARAIVVKESRAMAAAPKEIGKAVQDTEKQVNTALGKINNLFAESRKHMQQFANTGLGQLQQNLQGIQQKFNLISAAAAGFVGLGTRSAQQFKRIELGLTAMAGSQKRANDIMKEMRDLSEEFQQPYDQLLEGALSFIPIANQTGASMRELLLLSQKLQITNPMKNSGAIAFSIKEALSGDFVSLKDVADLAKSQRTELKKFIDKGDVQGFLDALNEILEKRGITTEALREMGESGVNAFARAQGAVNEAMSTAFTPFLEKIVLPLANKFADFVTQLNQTNPALLQLAGGAAIAVAAIAPLLVAVTSLISAYSTLKGLGSIAIPGLKGAGIGGVAKVAGMAGAGFLGVEIGKSVATRLAEKGYRSGDLGRIAAGEDAGDVLAERLKQIAVILTDAALKGADLIVRAFTVVKELVFQAGELVALAIAELPKAIEGFIKGKSLETTQGNVEYVAKTGRAAQRVADQAGQALPTDVKPPELSAFQKRLQEGISIDAALAEAEKASQDFAATREDIVRDLAIGLGLMEDKTVEMRDKFQDFIAMIEGVGNQLTGKLQAMVSVFKAPDFNEEQVTAYGEFQDKLTDIDQKAQDQRLQQEQSYQDQLSELQSRRELRDQREAEDLAIADRRRRKSLGEDLKSVDTQANTNIITAQQEANERRAEINDQYEREELERVRNYNLEREKEERQHRVTLLEAAASLNAIAVWRENNRYRLKKQEDATELREEEQRAKERRTRELQSLDETLEARIEREKTFAEKQKAEIQRRFDEQLALEAENRALMLQRRQEDEQLEDERLAAANQSRLDQIETQAAKERQVAEQAFIQTFNKLAQDAGMHQNTMINIQRKGQQQLEADLRNWWLRQKQVAQSAMGSVSSSRSSSYGSGITGVANMFSSAGQSIQNLFSGIGLSFDQGGRNPRTGLIFAHKDEEILRPDVSKRLRQMFGGTINQDALLPALAGAGAMSSTTIGDVNVYANFGDVGHYTPQQLMAWMGQVVEQELKDVFGVEE